MATEKVDGNSTAKQKSSKATIGNAMSQVQAEKVAFAIVIDGMKIPVEIDIPARASAGILVIPGSLNSDIDGNFAPMFPGQPPVHTNVYRDLAEQLCGEGLAVLRFAKTGPGTGSEVVNREEAKARYKLFPQRVRIAEVFLAELRRRVPEIPTIVAGHSEGAVVASLLTQKQPEVSGIVLLSGPSEPLLHMLIRQQFESDKRGGGVTTDVQTQYEEALNMLTDFVAARPLPPDFANNKYAASLSFVLRPENTAYLRSLESVDPTSEFARVLQPALIIQGGRDLSVFPENAELLHRARPDATMRLFPELQHCYKKVPAGMSPQESFSQSSQSDPVVARAIASWVKTVFKTEPQDLRPLAQ